MCPQGRARSTTLVTPLCNVGLLASPVAVISYYTVNNKKRSVSFKVARYSFSRSIPPKFERKLRRHKQRFGKIDTTVVLNKDENLL